MKIPGFRHRERNKKRIRVCSVLACAFILFQGTYGGGWEQPRLSRHYIGKWESFEVVLGLVPRRSDSQGMNTALLLAQAAAVPFKAEPERPYGANWDTPKDGTSIAELLVLAETNNPSLRMAKQKILAARGEWIQAGLKPNPVLAYEAEEVGDGGKAGKHGFVLEQEITTGGKRKWDRSIAAGEYHESQCRWELQYHAIRNDIKSMAYEVMAAEKNVEIRQRLADIGKKSVEAAVELGKAGEVSKIDLLQIRAKANESAAALKAAKSEQRIAWQKLACMVGIQDLEPTAIGEYLETVESEWDRDSDWCRLREGAPQLWVAKAKVKQARATLSRQEAGTKPDVTISGGVHYDSGERQTLASFGVGVPLQVFDRNQGNILKARAELASACRNLERQTLLLYEEFSEACAVQKNSGEQIVIYRSQILPDVQEALELSLQGYRQGEYSYMDVLNAQQLFLETQTQYVDVLKSHAVAGVYLDGYLVKGGLENPAE